MRHLDLFSGIGGFAYAVDQVWNNAEHIFCDNDKFCQQILKKHWPNSKIYEDIRTITDTEHDGLDGTKDTKGRLEGKKHNQKREDKLCQPEGGHSLWSKTDLLTGGFPCQPFSQAGRRKGTADDRYLWPEMFRVIRLTRPTWVIAENVAGLTTWNNGLVLEQVCSDLEAEGYEVQPFVIPAVAVNAPHRRDRVWIIANCAVQRQQGQGEYQRPKCSEKNKNRQTDSITGNNTEWNQNWLEVATELCRVDDGIPEGLDFASWTKAQHRVQRLKALGNAIVPQVAIEIMKGIKEIS